MKVSSLFKYNSFYFKADFLKMSHRTLEGFGLILDKQHFKNFQYVTFMDLNESFWRQR